MKRNFKYALYIVLLFILTTNVSAITISSEDTVSLGANMEFCQDYGTGFYACHFNNNDMGYRFTVVDSNNKIVNGTKSVDYFSNASPRSEGSILYYDNGNSKTITKLSQYITGYRYGNSEVYSKEIKRIALGSSQKTSGVNGISGLSEMLTRIKEGGNLFKTILSNAGVSVNDFKNNNYALLIEPIYVIGYNEKSGETKFKFVLGTATNIAQFLINNYKSNTHKLDGLTVDFVPNLACNVCTADTCGSNCPIPSITAQGNGTYVERYSKKIANLKKIIDTTKGYGMTKLYASEVYIPGYLKINKQDNLGNPVSGAKFNIYTGNGCNQNNILHKNKVVPGSLTLTLSPGSYSIKEISNNSNYYESPNGTCVNVTVESGKTATKTFTNTLNCSGELMYIRDNFYGDVKKQKLIDLYERYPSKNGLLNFDNPSCTSVTTCNNAKTQGCLTASFTPSMFNGNNLACYTNKLGITGTNNNAYCQTTLTVSNVIGKNSFSAVAGQMYITSPTGVAVTSTLTMNCYLYASSLPNSFSAGRYSDYLTDFEFDGELNMEKNPAITLKRQANSNLYTSSVSVDYYFKKIYANNGQATIEEVDYNKNATCSTCKFLGYGKISKFNDKFINEELPFEFKLTLEDDYDFSGSCLYTITPQLITKTPSNEDKLNLVFRTVNTNAQSSFLDKYGVVREAGSNWKGFEDILKINNNSYNRDGSTPKYKITLTPSIIKQIRKDNKNKSYNDYDFTCKDTLVGGKVCISNYLTKLKNNYGLQINNSKIRECIENDKTMFCDIK